MAEASNPYVFNPPVQGQNPATQSLVNSLRNWISGKVSLPAFLSGIRVGNASLPQTNPATGAQTADSPFATLTCTSQNALMVNTLPALIYNFALAQPTLVGTYTAQPILVQASEANPTTNASGLATVNYISAFPNGVLTVMITSNTWPVNVTRDDAAGAPTTGHFTVLAVNSTTGAAFVGGLKMSWLAVGF